MLAPFHLHAALAAILLLPAAVFGDTIKIVAPVWCPYTCESNSKQQGYIIDIARTIFESKGHAIAYENRYWTKSIRDTRVGNYDAIVGIEMDEGKDFIFPKEMVGMSSNTFVLRKESEWTYDGPASLEKISLAVIKGYIYGSAVDNFIEKHKHNKQKLQTISGITGETLAHNLKKVLIGTVDATIDDVAVIKYTILSMAEELNQPGLKGSPFKLVGGASSSDPVYMAFSPMNPKSQEYADLFDAGIKELRTQGKLAAIMANYGLESDWKN